MRIHELTRKTAALTDFMFDEWNAIHREHYGKGLDPGYWRIRYLILKATKGNVTLGALSGEFFGGVLSISELIVAGGVRGQGIGTALVRRAERWTATHGGHEVFLMTGRKWKSVDFYLKLGYRQTAALPRHYGKTDFIVLRKFITR